jgi:hypothetical protein
MAIADLAVALREAERDGLVEILRLETEPECWRRLGRSVGNQLRPDLFTALATGDYEHHNFVEVDLGTEGLPRLIAKCQTYVTYYETGTEQAKGGIFPRVVWLMEDMARGRQLLDSLHRRRLHPALFGVARLSDALTALTDGELPRAESGR